MLVSRIDRLMQQTKRKEFLGDTQKDLLVNQLLTGLQND